MIFQSHESKLWNHWIAKVFYRCGLIETWGRGTLKIAGLMQEAGLQAPVLKVNADFVSMTFVLQSGVDKTSEKASGKILTAVRQNHQVTIPELSAQIGVTSCSIERNLQKLQDEKHLRRVGPVKGDHWDVLE